MSILMAGLTPHPPLIIPEIGGDRRQKIDSTIRSLDELAEEVKKSEVDILITISPHGPVFTDAISIMDQKTVTGDFGDFGCPEVSTRVDTDPDFIRVVKEEAGKEGIEVITLSSADMKTYNIKASLDHGVLVPLYFLQKKELDIPVIPVTMGLLAYEELYKFGKIIRDVTERTGKDAVIIASGDLSHRLKPGAPAGFNPRGKEFDRELISLLQEERFEDILKMDQNLIEKAGECGLRPLVIMLGALHGKPFKTEVKSYEGPFGVGYAVVGFYPKNGGV